MGTRRFWASLLLYAVSCLQPLAGWAVPSGANDDPIEPVNRAIFWFNDQLDVYVLAPVAAGWDTIAPDRVEHALANFFQNLRFPIVALNDLLQTKLGHTAGDVGRFAVNSTVGVLGFFDPASHWGLEAHDEDFGQTLGYWGVPPGPYLVLPFFGPSDPRDAVGLAADSFSTVYPFFIAVEYSIAAAGMNTINSRALNLETIRQAKEASIDYYAFVRNAYRQRRHVLVTDGAVMSTQEEEDLYNVDGNHGEEQ